MLDRPGAMVGIDISKFAHRVERKFLSRFGGTTETKRDWGKTARAVWLIVEGLELPS